MKVQQGQKTVSVEQLTTLYDNGETGDHRFVLEEDENGLLYETSNAVTRQLVSSSMFMGWGIESGPRAAQWQDALENQFNDRAIAARYYAAATDQDK